MSDPDNFPSMWSIISIYIHGRNGVISLHQKGIGGWMILKQRDLSIDFLRGLAILFVICGHYILGRIYSLIFSFHIPLFSKRFITNRIVKLQLLWDTSDTWSNSLPIRFSELQKLCFNLTSWVAFVVPDYSKISRWRRWIKWVQL